MTDYLNNNYSRCQITACSSRHGHRWFLIFHNRLSYMYELFLLIESIKRYFLIHN